jgi:hypothetical protein
MDRSAPTRRKGFSYNTWGRATYRGAKTVADVKLADESKVPKNESSMAGAVDGIASVENSREISP